jgi:4-carboxymuconolactone decarboxylase
MPRIPLPSREEMTPEQGAVCDEVVAGKRGALVGPLRAAIHNPELARRWSALGEILRFDTSLPKRLSELAILVTGRRYTSQIEFFVHAKAGRDAGLDPAAIEAIRHAQPPALGPEEAEVYEFARQIHMTGQVPDAAYAAVLDRWGTRGVVELTALIGYYTMVSMTLNAHGVPLPDGEPDAVAPIGGGLVPLPPARRLDAS